MPVAYATEQVSTPRPTSGAHQAICTPARTTGEVSIANGMAPIRQSSASRTVAPVRPSQASASGGRLVLEWALST